MPSSQAPVVVIGAGLAGIAAACSLADQGIPVLLLERSSRLGGRAGSHRSAHGVATPIGSHLTLGCCTAYTELLQKLDTWHMVSKQERLRITVAAEGSQATLEAGPWPGPLTLAPSFLRYPFLDRRAKLATVRGLAAILRGDEALPEETFAAWLKRHHQPPTARRFVWELITAPTLNSSAEQAAAQFALLVFRLAVLARSKEATALGFLPQDASALLAPTGSYLQARGGQLRLGAGVKRIDSDATSESRCNKSRFAVHLTNGESLCAPYVIGAVPHGELLRLLPPAWQELPVFANLTRLPQRPIVDTFLIYDRPILEEPVLTIPGLPAVWVFPLPPKSNEQQINVSISCPGELVTLAPARIVSWTHTHLATALPEVGTARLVDAHVQKHIGATFSAAPQHQWLRPSALTPIPGLLLAGDWTATGWPATMEGAVRSGLKAASHVVF